MFLKNGNLRTAVKLSAGALLIYLFIVLFIYDYWFIGDEGYYSLSIYESIGDGLKPYITFLGKPAFWKPFLMVEAYALMSQLWGWLLPATASYRACSAVFSALSVGLVYLISREFLDEKKALLAAVVYALNPIILIYGTKIFMESFAMFFVLAGLLAAIQLCKGGRNEALLAGVIALAVLGAAFGKSTTIGIMAVMIYGMYAFFADRGKVVWVGAAAVIAAAVALSVPFLTEFPEAYFRLYMEDFFTKRIGGFWPGNLVSTIGALVYLVPALIIGWGRVQLNEWKNVFLLLWIAPLLLIAFKTPYVWYAYYFVLPISIIALAGIKVDALDVTVLLMLVMVGVLIFVEVDHRQKNETAVLKTIGFIKENVGKESCILYAGAITPMVYSYLGHEGHNYNIALTNVLLRNGTDLVMDAGITQEQLDSLVFNYRGAEFPESLSKKEYIFAEWNVLADELLFRTDNYGCTDFEYVIVTDYYRKYELENYSILYEDEQARAWKRED